MEGEELADHLAAEERRQEQEAAEAAKAARSGGLMEDEESDVDEEEAGEEASILATQFDVYVRDAVRSGGFFKQNQSYRMFPAVEARRKWDDYGEAINPAMYMIGEFHVAAPAAEDDVTVEVG